MIKKSFWGFKKTDLKYDLDPPSFRDVSPPREATVFLKRPNKITGEKLFQVGNQVKTGQKLSSSSDSSEYVICPVAGKISDIFSYSDAYGRHYDGIKIESGGKDDWDDQLKGKVTLEAAIDFLEFAPGKFSFRKFKDAPNKIDTIIINGLDADLGITVNQGILKTKSSGIKKGIDLLKKITGVNNVIIVVPEILQGEVKSTGLSVKILPASFPNALPAMIIKNVLDKDLPAGKNPEDIGVTLISAESVAAIAFAFDGGKIPVTKALSVIQKDGTTSNVTARIGTPIGDILSFCNVSVGENDRIIMGGSMMGTATYSKDLPIEPDTDAITVQSEADSAIVSDYPCINCGECVRICPAKIQVNLLGKYAEFGLYEDTERCDIYSCIECSLCAYVCTAKRPLMQYIKLAKYELAIIKNSEAVDE